VILTRQPGRSVGRSVALAGLALVGLVLSGCSSIGIHPGSAAVVGDESLSMSKIDDTATLYCKAYLPQIQQSSTAVIPMRLLRQYVAASLSQRLLGEQLATQYDVQPGSQYTTRIGQIEQQFATAAPDAKKAVVDVEGGDPYLQTVQVAIGQKLLADSGQPPGTAKAALQRGEVATQDWLKTHSISIDPVFGVAVDGGTFKPVSDQTSYPLSALASQGASGASQPDAAYVGALAPAQVCG
jgi:hypothetical protein